MRNFVFLIIFSLIALYLASCSTMYKTEDVAQKAYELGCLDKSRGNPVDSYNCHKASERFKKELHNAWVKQ